MAKSIRSKRERKFRAIKRKLNEKIELERLEKCVTLHEHRLKQEEVLETPSRTDATDPMPHNNDIPMTQSSSTLRHNRPLRNRHKMKRMVRKKRNLRNSVFPRKSI
jgi:hypothetical protein